MEWQCSKFILLENWSLTYRHRYWIYEKGIQVLIEISIHLFMVEP